MFSKPCVLFKKRPVNRESYTTEITANLNALKISQKAIQRIMNAVDKMPGTDHILGALKFLTKLTAKKSVREDYYQYSDYIAEFFCTISNLGLFAVGFYFGDYATILAATFSALSHAIPLQRLHDLDILGILLIFAKVIANYTVLTERPDVVAYGVGALTINILDTVITRQYLDKTGPALHVTWHLAAAGALYMLNQAIAGTPKALPSPCIEAAKTSSCTLF